MRAPHVLGVALLLAVCGFFWGSPKVRAAELVKHHYKVIDLEFSRYKETKEWKDALALEGDNEFRARPRFEEAVLTHWGDRGWRLIQVVKRSSSSVLIYLEK